jgi:hypothetical protein
MQPMPSDLSHVAAHSDFPDPDPREQRSSSAPAGDRDPEADLTQSLNRLHELRLAALVGGHYDPDEFDDAVLAFRRAWEVARQSGHAERRQVA